MKQGQHNIIIDNLLLESGNMHNVNVNDKLSANLNSYGSACDISYSYTIPTIYRAR